MSEPEVDQSTQDEVPYCRVCHGESEPNRELYYPCKCDGSIKYVHQDCLIEWLKHSKQKKCELCGTEFKFKNIYKQGAPLHLTILDLVTELIPKLFEIVKIVIVICFSCFLWGFTLPVFTNFWFHFCWCVVSESDIPTCFETTLFQSIQLDRIPTSWYAGIINLCMIFIISVFLLEMGRIVMKEIKAIRASYQMKINERHSRMNCDYIRDLSIALEDLVLDFSEIIQKHIQSEFLYHHIEKSSGDSILDEFIRVQCFGARSSDAVRKFRENNGKDGMFWLLKAEEIDLMIQTWKDKKSKSRQTLADLEGSSATGVSLMVRAQNDYNLMTEDQILIVSLRKSLESIRQMSKLDLTESLIGYCKSIDKLADTQITAVRRSIPALAEVNFTDHWNVFTDKLKVDRKSLLNAMTELITSLEARKDEKDRIITVINQYTDKSNESYAVDPGDFELIGNFLLLKSTKERESVAFENMKQDNLIDEDKEEDKASEISEIGKEESPICEKENLEESNEDNKPAEIVKVAEGHGDRDEDENKESEVFRSLSSEEAEENVWDTSVWRELETPPLPDNEDFPEFDISNNQSLEVPNPPDAVPVEDYDADEKLEEMFERYIARKSNEHEAEEPISINEGESTPLTTRIPFDHRNAIEQEVLTNEEPENNRIGEEKEQEQGLGEEPAIHQPNLAENPVEEPINADNLVFHHPEFPENINRDLVIQPALPDANNNNNDDAVNNEIGGNEGNDVRNNNNNNNNNVPWHFGLRQFLFCIHFIALFLILTLIVPALFGKFISSTIPLYITYSNQIREKIKDILMHEGNSAVFARFLDIPEESLDWILITENEKDAISELCIGKVLAIFQILIGYGALICGIILFVISYTLHCFTEMTLLNASLRAPAVVEHPLATTGETRERSNSFSASSAFTRLRNHPAIKQTTIKQFLYRLTMNFLDVFLLHFKSTLLLFLYFILQPTMLTFVFLKLFHIEISEIKYYIEKNEFSLIILLFIVFYFLAILLMGHIFFIAGELRSLLKPTILIDFLPKENYFEKLFLLVNDNFNANINNNNNNNNINNINNNNNHVNNNADIFGPGIIDPVLVPLANNQAIGEIDAARNQQRINNNNRFHRRFLEQQPPQTLLQRYYLFIEKVSFLDLLKNFLIHCCLLLIGVLVSVILPLKIGHFISLTFQPLSMRLSALSSNSATSTVTAAASSTTAATASASSAASSSSSSSSYWGSSFTSVPLEMLISHILLPYIIEKLQYTKLIRSILKKLLLNLRNVLELNDFLSINGFPELQHELAPAPAPVPAQVPVAPAPAVVPPVQDPAPQAIEAQEPEEQPQEHVIEEEEEEDHPVDEEVIDTVPPENNENENQRDVPPMEPATLPTIMNTLNTPSPSNSSSTSLGLNNEMKLTLMILSIFITFTIFSSWIIHIPLFVGRYLLITIYKLPSDDFFNYPVGFILCYTTIYIFQYIMNDILHYMEHPTNNNSVIVSFLQIISKWILLGMKIMTAGLLWLLIPPLFVGYVIENAFIVPFRTEIYTTPVFPFIQSWILGLIGLKLFIKCVLTGVFGEIEIRNHLEMTIIRGFTQFELIHFITKIFIPIILPLMDIIFIPYGCSRIIGMTIQSYKLRTFIIRFAIHGYILVKLLWYLLIASIQYAINLHNEIRDNRYLLSTELTNRQEKKE